MSKMDKNNILASQIPFSATRVSFSQPTLSAISFPGSLIFPPSAPGGREVERPCERGLPFPHPSTKIVKPVFFLMCRLHVRCVLGGTNTGVMKHVGEAVKEQAITFGSEDKVNVIGIATWGIVDRKDSLIGKVI